jgi:UDP-N-acetylmuramate dehydrogenase
MVQPQSIEQLKSVLQILAAGDAPYMVMGNGSNILVKDSGYKGVIVKLGDAFNSIDIDGTVLVAGCGTLMSQVAKAALDKNLTGFEFASGIPGSLGGAVFMNAGAYGGEMVHIVKEAKLVSRDGSREYTMSCDELQLSYRHSILHETGDIVVSVTLQLEEGNKEEISATMKELASKRNEKQPVHLPSAGSFFKRPEGYFAGKLIQDAGLRGYTVGGAQVSEKHCGFVINAGGATAADVMNLMKDVSDKVNAQYGVTLEPEVKQIGEF